MATSITMTPLSTPYLIAVEDPARADVQALVRTHREWSLIQTPSQHSFSVEPEAVAQSGITLFGARSATGELLGIGGLKELTEHHGEIKTMHTAAEARGQHIGRGVLEALLVEARRRGYHRVSLETGTGEPFQAARNLYESVGFSASEPFGSYANTDYNLCMTLRLVVAHTPSGR